MTDCPALRKINFWSQQAFMSIYDRLIRVQGQRIQLKFSNNRPVHPSGCPRRIYMAIEPRYTKFQGQGTNSIFSENWLIKGLKIHEGHKISANLKSSPYWKSPSKLANRQFCPIFRKKGGDFNLLKMVFLSEFFVKIWNSFRCLKRW